MNFYKNLEKSGYDCSICPDLLCALAYADDILLAVISVFNKGWIESYGQYT